MKIVTIVGARPQFIKTAMISLAFEKYPDVEEIIVHSGQHFDQNMSEIFFQQMKIKTPKYFLDLNGLSHGAMIGRMIEEIEKILIVEKPNYVVVFGDTNTTLAGAISAKKLNIKIVHIEAGVRNFDEEMPEEANRYLVDRMSNINFCCTSLGVKNLEIEGYFSENINSKVLNHGDVMFDATLHFKNIAMNDVSFWKSLNLEFNKYVLCTIHRASNTDDEEILTSIVNSLNEINKSISVVFPIHPRTKQKINQLNLEMNFKVLNPLGYFEMLQLIENCKYVLTDSGGVIREAYFLRKPSLLVLEQPLWSELVSAEVSLNCKPIEEEIHMAFERLREIKISDTNNIFGNGKAADLIVKSIYDDFNER